MVITDAIWEQRNLGVSTVEVQFDNSDTLLEIEDLFRDISAQYIVLKVPCDRNDIVDCVQKHGYRYVEDMIHVVHDLHEVTRSRMHQRLYDATSFRRMDMNDIEQLRTETAAGMFSSDRISNDPFFGLELAGQRYMNWLDDLIEKQALPYAILYKNEPAGFVVLQTRDGVTYQSVLGGSYRKYRHSGIGIVQKEQEIVKLLGGKRVETHVSSNNPGQLRALEINGYTTKEINHIFVKHNL